MAEQWYSIVEYARAFSISDMTVRRRIKNGKLKAVLKDGKYYIPIGAGAGQSVPKESAPQPTTVKQVTRPVNTTMPEKFSLPEAEVHRSDRLVSASSAIEPLISTHVTGTPRLPETVKKPLAVSETSLVHTQSLLAFCDQVIHRHNTSETHIRQSYQNKIAALEATIRAKDAELVNLRQQIEDLQLLVKVFEKNK